MVFSYMKSAHSALAFPWMHTEGSGAPTIEPDGTKFAKSNHQRLTEKPVGISEICINLINHFFQ